MQQRYEWAKLPLGPLEANCYILACATSRRAAVIDPGDCASRVTELAAKRDWKICAVINTHGHFDHVGANDAVCKASGAPLMIHEYDVPLLERTVEHAALYDIRALPSPPPDRILNDGDLIPIGELELAVIHTPGHSPGSICLLCRDLLFTGDTLFQGSIGRTDLPGGDYELLIASITGKLNDLQDATLVLPGHGPGSSLGTERRFNPFLNQDRL